MAIDMTKLNAGVSAIEAKLADVKNQLAAAQAQLATLQGQAGETAADQAAVDAVGDKLSADAQ